MREIVDLGDDVVEPVDFLHDNLVEFLTKIGVFKSFRQQLGKSLDGDEWIADLMGHTGGEIGPECGSIKKVLLFAQAFLGG